MLLAVVLGCKKYVRVMPLCLTSQNAKVYLVSNSERYTAYNNDYCFQTWLQKVFKGGEYYIGAVKHRAKLFERCRSVL